MGLQGHAKTVPHRLAYVTAKKGILDLNETLAARATRHGGHFRVSFELNKPRGNKPIAGSEEDSS
jgi:hypothetical protein